jgi:DNA processing protein
MMNWADDDKNVPPKTKNKKQSPPDFTAYSPDEAAVLVLLHDTPEMHIDEISWKSQVPINKLAALLLELEFKGMIKALPGKKFALSFIM